MRVSARLWVGLYPNRDAHHASDHANPDRPVLTTPAPLSASGNSYGSHPHLRKENSMPNTVKPLSVRKTKEQMSRYRAALLNNPMTLKVVEKSNS